MILTQTAALLVDGYRELSAKKLFWITMMLSGGVVAVFAAFGINAKGLTFLWWQFETPLFTSTLIPPAKFYAWAFANIGIPIWLTWAASILAIISTASIFPDFIASGAIELTLSKPIGRLRLFLTKYTSGLLFVALQVLAFAAACFLVVRIRGGVWDVRFFLSVPIVVLFFSYLFAFCVLFGLLTRSTIASLLLTCLIWIALWGLTTSHDLFIFQRAVTAVNVTKAERTVAKRETAARKILDEARARGEPTPSEAGPLPANVADELEVANPMLISARSDLAAARVSESKWKSRFNFMHAAWTAFPKTKDTIRLLDRWMLTEEEKKLFRPDEDSELTEDSVRFGEPDPEVNRWIESAIRQPSVARIIGTSLLFEAAVLALGAWIFCRRDF